MSRHDTTTENSHCNQEFEAWGLPDPQDGFYVFCNL